ncbi:DegV family protein [Lacticaseibacillus sp. GG6-2]
MSKIAIVTDSTAYLTTDQISGLPIRIVTTPLIVGGETFDEGVDITPKEFYAKMRAASDFPHTSQPRLADVLATHRELKEQGYDTVLNIYLSKTISGIYSTVSAAAPDIEGQQVVVYDSQITVILMGQMVLTAGKMAAAGASLDAIIARLDQLRASVDEYFIVNDLMHLVRGGRLSNTAGMLGNMLHIKPLLTFDETHKIVVFEKIRTLSRAYARVEALFTNALAQADYPLKAWVISAGNDQEADSWQHKLQQQFPQATIERSFFGPAITTHIGENAIALAWIRDPDRDGGPH